MVSLSPTRTWSSVEVVWSTRSLPWASGASVPFVIVIRNTCGPWTGSMPERDLLAPFRCTMACAKPLMAVTPGAAWTAASAGPAGNGWPVLVATT